MSDRPKPAQALIIAGLLLGLIPLLAGCGKRATMVDAPPDATVTHYPQNYPDQTTDPPATYHGP